MLTLGRWLTVFGYFALIALLLVWNAWLSPPAELPRSFVLILLLTPLMFPLRGILHGKSYTHAWASFMALFYFLLGITSVSSTSSATLYGLLQILFSLLMFSGCILYVRGLKTV